MNEHDGTKRCCGESLCVCGGGVGESESLQVDHSELEHNHTWTCIVPTSKKHIWHCGSDLNLGHLHLLLTPHTKSHNWQKWVRCASPQKVLSCHRLQLYLINCWHNCRPYVLDFWQLQEECCSRTRDDARRWYAHSLISKWQQSTFSTCPQKIVAASSLLHCPNFNNYQHTCGNLNVCGWTEGHSE